MNEVTSIDEQRIIELLSGLDRVSTPGDFNFRVRSKIAAGTPNTTRAWMPSALKIAFPVLLLMLISGFFLVRDNGRAVDEQLARVDDVQLVPSAVSQEPAGAVPNVTSQSPTAIASPALRTVEKSAVVSGAKPETRSTDLPKKALTAVQPDTSAPSGSYDVGSGVSRGISLPLNGNVNKPEAIVPKPATRPTRLSASGVLSLMGAKGTYSGPVFQVNAITAGSAAAQAGLRPGDIIEAINGQALSSGLTFAHDFSGGSLRVRRNSQVITLSVGQ